MSEFRAIHFSLAFFGILAISGVRSCFGQALVALEPEKSRSSSAETQRAWANQLKLLRAGSGTDRLDRRRELMANFPEVEGAFTEELRGGSQSSQRQICLILMERPDSKFREPLERLVDGSGRGDSTGAALALGILGDPRSGSALQAARTSGQPVTRRAALLALARGNFVEAEAEARRILKDRPRPLDKEAARLVLAMVAASHAAEDNLLMTDPSDEPGRRLGALILGRSEPGASRASLLRALKDSDAEVVDRAMASLLARVHDAPFSGPDRVLIQAVPGGFREHPAWAWLLSAALGSECLPTLTRLRSETPTLNHRITLAAAAFMLPELAGGEWARAFLADSEPAVREVALIALVALATQDGGITFAVHAEDREESVRATAYLCEVAARGKAALPLLAQRRLGAQKGDDWTIALQMTAALEEDEAWARVVARARLQVRLDTLGGAPSWAWFAKLQAAVRRILEIEDALPRGGGGASTSGSAGARGLGAAAHRVSNEDEDLRRHLDVYPYFTGPREAELFRSSGR